MTESFIGLMIAAIATSSLMLAIKSMEKSYRNAGKYSLTQQELIIINNAGLNSQSNINLLKEDIQNLPQSF
tara:strand:- start:461 stop:673 length:213 start_codon:yes stop_codon:yes gene_type:complete